MLTTPSPADAEARGARSNGALTAWLALAALQIFAAFAAARAGATTDDGDLEPVFRYDVAVGSFVVYGVLALLAVGIAAFGFGNATTELGLRRFPARWIFIAVGVVVLMVVVSAALEQVLHAGEEQGLAPTRWHPERAGAFAANAVVITAVGPFTEELFYRGLGIRVLAFVGAPTAATATALAFGFAHGLLVALPVLGIFGLLLAWIRIRSESVWPAVFAHALYNGVGIAVAAYCAMNPGACP